MHLRCVPTYLELRRRLRYSLTPAATHPSTMAAAVAAAAAATVTKPPFKIGTKQVFLPRHVVALLRSRENEPPHFATFKVPLTFNKLDLRDYLLHVYNVPVTAVRSQLRLQRPRKSTTRRRLVIPRPIKTMTVELTRPFVWPERPTDVTAWNTPHMERQIREMEKNRRMQDHATKTGRIPLHAEEGDDIDRTRLRADAARVLKSGSWTNGRPLDPKFAKGQALDAGDSQDQGQPGGEKRKKEKKRWKKRDEQEER
ncbi:hypothetical protein GGS23DRAFT_34196 [Durotheca rogersii]|uniref:uncharacterized protein n=1 Tax=Durotheca rogersii TaxID=419775 RepID=UPI002221047F|nr:uncharacterized protein GGS23DRAFT_34196 [Durotheca rogersii]KAI5868511.1 hypothetical protein GGS23DRAFT_34196 [Durotheca rogersii]